MFYQKLKMRDTERTAACDNEQHIVSQGFKGKDGLKGLPGGPGEKVRICSHNTNMAIISHN